MRFSCEHCAATNIDASWRWCPECGAFPANTDTADRATADDARLGFEWPVGASVLF
jgi:hypothetical protein